ncbi:MULTISPECIES: MFS transporter AraJ [Bacteroides]|uniref:MFS transporter AraJ n=1 Tax=Bacteroides TaxID=816 RepID=UPI000E443631|nr:MULTISPECIES: MFS transporter AraJ [Bacteroides]MBS7573984.1 MFS transporter AraJ [Bacteroides propionicigenes]RGM27781.1 MFS transporter AraJ [Bacteroides sp. OM08-17BH]HBO06446.1 MFS transporter AraJ [Bacteroides sp.]
MKKSLIALAFGTLGLGIAEFTMMGILPYVAQDLNISIPVAGHFISAYALGVCAGAPMLILARKRPLKHILLVLMALMLVGNLGAAMAPDYWLLLAARFISGLPHGAYFGVASIVAGKLADEGKSSEAVSIMIAGMTVANLFGVPLGTSLSHMLSWRVTFLLVGCWGLIVLYYIWRWVPAVEGLKDTGFKGQFRFLKTPAPWLILGATALGNGGVFCWYSYITPLLTNVSGFSAESVTALMVLAGFGMVVGNLVSGRLSDKYTPGKVGTIVQGMICIVLLMIFFLSPNPWCSAILMALCTAGLFAVSSPEQVLIIRVAPGGEMLGGACVQMAFNLGNAIGAYVGGLALSGGYRYPALAGVPFALTGFILFLIFYKKFQAKY